MKGICWSRNDNEKILWSNENGSQTENANVEYYSEHEDPVGYVPMKAWFCRIVSFRRCSHFSRPVSHKKALIRAFVCLTYLQIGLYGKCIWFINYALINCHACLKHCAIRNLLPPEHAVQDQFSWPAARIMQLIKKVPFLDSSWECAFSSLISEGLGSKMWRWGRETIFDYSHK